MSVIPSTKLVGALRRCADEVDNAGNPIERTRVADLLRQAADRIAIHDGLATPTLSDAVDALDAEISEYQHLIAELTGAKQVLIRVSGERRP